MQHVTILIGFSFASQSTDIAFNLAKVLKDKCNHTPLIFGGVHPTIDPISCLDYCDAVCIGEGEKTILEVAKRLTDGDDFFQTNNLIYKKDGKIIENQLNQLIKELDSLPVRRSYTEDHLIIRKGKVFNVDHNMFFEILPNERTCYTQIFSRGCPYGCSYCCNSKYKEIYPDWTKIRNKSVSGLIDEISENIRNNPGIIKVFIIDDCFLAHDIKWLEEFTAQWKEKVNKELNFFTIPEYVKKEKLEILKKIDFSYCSIGLQSGCKKTNQLYNRKFSKELFLDACNLIKSMDIGLVVNVILDNPWENDSDILDTLDVLTRMKKPYYIMQYSLKIYPGTKLYSDCVYEKKKIPDFNLWYKNYNVIQAIDSNRIMILAQFLPRNLIMNLFKNREKVYAKISIRCLYIIACMFIPFHALRVSGSKKLSQNISIIFSHRHYAITWIKGLLGIRN